MVNYEAIVNIVGKVSELNGAPCKKTLQKIVFLIQAKQVDLGCDYGIHYYGPYSADLDFAVRELCDDGVLSIQYTKLEHNIYVKDDLFGEGYSNPVVDDIIEKFAKDSPSELELIATALYVYMCVRDVSKVKLGVYKIKGDKFFGSQIDSAIERLVRCGYIS